MFKYFISLLIVVSLCTPTFSQTFSATVNSTIPDDGSQVAFDIVVTGLPTVIDTLFGLETACINLNHTWDSDMEIKLKAPDGTTVILLSGVGGDQDNFTNTCLGDATNPPLSGASAPFTGLFAAMGTIGNVNNGQNPNGVWQLLLRDTYPQDQGFLISWQITFGNQPVHPFVFASSNLPIAKINTNGNSIPNDPKVLAHLQIIDNGPGIRNYSNQTNYAHESDILVELQGFTGPSYPKKNYDFDLIDSVGNKIDLPLLGMPTENDWIFKAEYLDHSLMKNSIAYEMSRRMGRYAPRNKFCELILDGEYMGVYTLTEKIKRDANRVDIAKLTPTDTAGSNLTGGYIIEMNINGAPGAWNSIYPPINNATCSLPVEFKYVYPSVADLQPQQSAYIKNYVDTFENVLHGNNFLDSLNGYRKYISVKNFIDFLIVNEFSVNYDSYGRSTFLFKEKDTDGNQLKIGPPWDYDRAMEYNNPGSTNGWVWEITHQGWPFPFWWSKMWQDSTYRKELACRWTTLRQSTLHNDSFMAYIDTLKAYIYEGQTRNFTVWNDLGGATYDTQIDSLKSYLTRRLQWIDNELAQENVSLPVITFPANKAICQGDTIDAFMGNTYDYNWIPGPDTSIFSPSTEGIYQLKVTDAYGCYNIKPIDIVFSKPDASFTAQPAGGTGATWAFTPTTNNAGLYSWTFGDGTGTSSIIPGHTFATGGSYIVTLTVTDSIGCKSTETDTLQVTIAGLPTLSEAAMPSIFPNPFKESLDIVFGTSPLSDWEISIWDETGKCVYQSKENEATLSTKIATHTWAEGVYILKIATDKGQATVKRVKVGR